MSRDVQVQTTHDGQLFKVQVLTWTDEQGRPVRREIVRHPGAVLVVPVLDEDRMVLIRNYRIAPDEVLWEFPAGKLEPGEDPEHAAGRELQEETGFAAARLRKLGEFYTSPGFTDELMRVFIAEELTAVGQRLEPGEDIQVRTLDVSEVMAMLERGEIRDAKTVAGFLMWHALARGAIV